jgi:OmpA-OmpF porin, OOP family
MAKKALCLVLFGLFVLLQSALAEDDVLSKYSFIPGEKLLVFEDLSGTSIGEIPLSLNSNGNGQIILLKNERWLRMDAGLELHFALKGKLDDLTLEMYHKVTSTDFSCLAIELRNEAKGYHARFLAGTIAIGLNGASWMGSLNDNDLPGGEIYKDVFKPNQSVQFALTIQKERVKFFVDRQLVANVAGLAPVMPDEIYIYAVSNTQEDEWDKKAMFLVRDISAATGVPDIANEILTKGKHISHGVRFEPGTAVIKEESYAVLRQVAGVLIDNPDVKLLISAHTDNLGKKEDSLKLTIAQAESVKKYLVEKLGIKEERLQTEGKGDTVPIADNKTLSGRAANRRIEFIKAKETEKVK